MRNMLGIGAKMINNEKMLEAYSFILQEIEGTLTYKIMGYSDDIEMGHKVYRNIVAKVGNKDTNIGQVITVLNEYKVLKVVSSRNRLGRKYFNDRAIQKKLSKKYNLIMGTGVIADEVTNNKMISEIKDMTDDEIVEEFDKNLDKDTIKRVIRNLQILIKN